MFLLLFIICRSTKAVCWCSDWSVANPTHSRRQWGQGFESEVDNEGGSQVLQPSLLVWWGLYHLMDTMWKEAYLLLPRNQIHLWPWHLLWPRGTYMFGLHLYYDAWLIFLMHVDLVLMLNQCYLGLLKCNESLKLCSSRRKRKINIKLIFRRFGHIC